MKARHLKLVGAAVRILVITSLLVTAGVTSAQSPYSPGSPADNILKFSSGGSGVATAELPEVTLLVGTNPDRDNSTGGGWTIGATGAVNVGIEVTIPPLITIVAPLASSQAQTSIGINSLSFQTVSDGLLGGLASPGLFMSWDASTSIASSTGWAAGTYAYEFDLAVSNSLLGLNPSVLGSFNLQISDGSGILFNGSVFGSLLGVANITNANYADVRAIFDYNPTNGPLNIQFTANAAVDADALAIFEEATVNTLYNVSDADIVVVPVPEPGSAILLGISGMLLIVRRRRRMV